MNFIDQKSLDTLRLFSVFDKNRDGVISPSDLRSFFYKGFQIKLSRDEAKQILRQVNEELHVERENMEVVDFSTFNLFLLDIHAYDIYKQKNSETEFGRVNQSESPIRTHTKSPTKLPAINLKRNNTPAISPSKVGKMFPLDPLRPNLSPSHRAHSPDKSACTISTANTPELSQTNLYSPMTCTYSHSSNIQLSPLNNNPFSSRESSMFSSTPSPSTPTSIQEGNLFPKIPKKNSEKLHESLSSPTSNHLTKSTPKQRLGSLFGFKGKQRNIGRELNQNENANKHIHHLEVKIDTRDLVVKILNSPKDNYKSDSKELKFEKSFIQKSKKKRNEKKLQSDSNKIKDWLGKEQSFTSKSSVSSFHKVQTRFDDQTIVTTTSNNRNRRKQIENMLRDVFDLLDEDNDHKISVSDLIRSMQHILRTRLNHYQVAELSTFMEKKEIDFNDFVLLLTKV